VTRPNPIVLPSSEDPVVRESAEVVGGPTGRWARIGRSWWTPIRVLIVLATGAYLVGYLLDLSCRGDGWASPARYEHLCYSDIPPLYALRGFADGLVPYLQPMADGTHLEYPVLTGVFMWVSAIVTAPLAGLAGIDTGTVFFDVNVALLFLAFIVAVVATALTVRRRPWDAAMVALAPTMILGATINWDLIPLALIGLALLAWSRRYPFAAGLILGLAIAAKFYPVILLGGFLLLSLRSAKWRAFAMLVLGSAASWLAVNLPFMVANPEGWSWFYRFSQERGEDFGSLWYALNLAGIARVPAESLNSLATGTFVVLCAGIAAVVLSAPQRPRLAAVLFLIVVAFVLTNKVYSPQYSLWLIPLAVMARPRWTSFLIWQAGEVVYFVAIWWYLAGYGIEEASALQGPEYAVAILIRMLATIYLAALVIQDMFVPAYDPVRSDGERDDEDDPGGGVYDEAADRFTLRRN
jgi:uncharacterized membrane protein